MAHTSCPNGHDMWNGDGKPVVLKHSEILVVTDVLDEGEAKFYMQNVINKN